MGPCPWSAYQPGSIAFCETRLCAWVVEPSNAWSNAAYLAAGIAVLDRARRRAPLVLVGLAAICIGLGSFAFHGTGTRAGELVDVSAMYLLSALALVFVLRRLTSLSTMAFVATYLAIVGSSVSAMILLGNNGIFVFAAQLALGIAAEVYLYAQGTRAPDHRWQKWMIVSFVVAFALWNADKWNLLCNPDNHLVTGHAIWHVLTAVALYCFARQQEQLVA